MKQISLSLLFNFCIYRDVACRHRKVGSVWGSISNRRTIRHHQQTVKYAHVTHILCSGCSWAKDENYGIESKNIISRGVYKSAKIKEQLYAVLNGGFFMHVLGIRFYAVWSHSQDRWLIERCCCKNSSWSGAKELFKLWYPLRDIEWYRKLVYYSV